MSYKRLKLLSMILLVVAIMSMKFSVIIIKNYYYSTSAQKTMHDEISIKVPDIKTAIKP